jgi:hypothetical protein
VDLRPAYPRELPVARRGSQRGANAAKGRVVHLPGVVVALDEVRKQPFKRFHLFERCCLEALRQRGLAPFDLAVQGSLTIH